MKGVVNAWRGKEKKRTIIYFLIMGLIFLGFIIFLMETLYEI